MMQCIIIDYHEYGVSSDLTTAFRNQHVLTKVKAYSNIDRVL